MDKKDLLEQKESELHAAGQAVQDMQLKVESKLNELIKSMDSDAMVVRTHVRRPWSSKHLDDEWEVDCTIGFPGKEGRQLDFGSTIDVELFTSKLEVNVGTCGSYDNTDIYQVRRVHLLSKMWNAESTLLKELSGVVEIELVKEYEHLFSERDQIKREIREAEDAAERASLLEQLSKAKYIYGVRQHYNYETKKYENSLGSVRKIIKITDKTVITNDCNDAGESYYPGSSNNWEKLGFIIGSLKAGTIYLSDSVGRNGELIGVSE